MAFEITIRTTLDEIVEEERRLAHCAKSADDFADEKVREARSLFRTPEQVKALRSVIDEKRAKAEEYRTSAKTLRENWIKHRRSNSP